MPRHALSYASLLGVAVFAAACGLEPLGEGAGGTGTTSPGSTTSQGSTTSTLVDSATAGTTGASSTGGSDGTASGSTTAAGTITGGTAGTTGGTGSGTAGTTGGTVTGGGNACTPDGWDNYAKAKFSSACAGCHGISFNTLAQVVNDQAAVESRVKSKNMPKGTTLDTDTYNRLVKWMDCGLPQ